MTEDLKLAVLTDEELDAVSGGIANVAANNLVNVQANVSNVLNNNDVAAAVGVLSSGVGAFAPR
jgi:bacteriocin-like protein